MANATDVHGMEHRHGRAFYEVEAVGSFSEAIGGVGVVVLSIIGLAGILPQVLLAIAVIAMGGSLLFEGGSIAAEYSRLFEKSGETHPEFLEWGSGMSVEFLGGLVGIILGILSLIGLDARYLLPVAAIVFGCELLMAAGTLVRLSNYRIASSGASPGLQMVARDWAKSTAGTQVLVGLGAVVLGILGVISSYSIVLALIALLALGGSVVLNSSAMGARMLSVFRGSEGEYHSKA